MSSCTYTVPQPYEIIETSEETITRYIGPNLREPKNFPSTDTHNSGNNRTDLYKDEQNDYTKIILRNCQFQDLFERFNKLRSAMSEIGQRLKDINLINEKTNKFSAANGIYTGNEFIYNIGNETRIQENAIDLENAKERVQEKIKKCDPKVIVESVEVEMANPTKPVSNGENIYHSFHSDMHYTHSHQPKRTELALLEKSKRLLIYLIDKELEKGQSGQNVHTDRNISIPLSLSHRMQHKLECIDKIKEELCVLKDLEGFDT